MKKPIRTHKSGVPAGMSPSASAAPSGSRKNNFDLDRLLISLDRREGTILWRVAELFACLLTVLLPVKFASFVSAPEGGALYWSDPLSLAFIAWPGSYPYHRRTGKPGRSFDSAVGYFPAVPAR